MKGSKKYDNARKQLRAYIRTHNMRPSAVRDLVLEQACLLRQPFTAEQLIQVCATERISTGTVYNTLSLCIKAKIIQGLPRQRGHMITEYELINDGAKRMQCVCVQCGRVSDFRDKAIARLIEERKYSNFYMNQYSLVVYGICKVCKNKITTA